MAFEHRHRVVDHATIGQLARGFIGGTDQRVAEQKGNVFFVDAAVSQIFAIGIIERNRVNSVTAQPAGVATEQLRPIIGRFAKKRRRRRCRRHRCRCGTFGRRILLCDRLKCGIIAGKHKNKNDRQRIDFMECPYFDPQYKF